MAFLGKFVGIRFDPKTWKAALELLEKYPDKYESLSQLVRCAVIILLNQEREVEEREYRRLKSNRT